VRHGFPDRCDAAWVLVPFGTCALLVFAITRPTQRATTGGAFCVIRVAVSGASGGTAS